MGFRGRLEARAYLESKIASDPVSYGNHHKLAALLDDGDLALEHLEFAVSAKPSDIKARNDLALKLFERGQWCRAVEELETCLAIDSKSSLAHKNLSAVYARRGRYDEALRHAQTAVALSPNDAQAHRNLAKLYDCTRGDSRLAVKHNAIAIRNGPGKFGLKDPNDAEAYRRIAIQSVGRAETEEGKAHEHYDQYRALTNKTFVLPNSHTTIELLLKARQSNLSF